MLYVLTIIFLALVCVVVTYGWSYASKPILWGIPMGIPSVLMLIWLKKSKPWEDRLMKLLVAQFVPLILCLAVGISLFQDVHGWEHLLKMGCYIGAWMLVFASSALLLSKHWAKEKLKPAVPS